MTRARHHDRASVSYQMWDWFAGAFGPYPNGGYLPVTGITQVPVEPGAFQKAAVEFTYDNDIDGDEILTPDDNCPFVANDLQLDQDQDGLGDMCDDCFLDPDNDIDHDGACGDVDNCPVTPNWDQRNANLLVEEVFHGKKLGNACDPVPSADQHLEQHFVEHECQFPCTPYKKQKGICHPDCPEKKPGKDVSIVCVEDLKAEIVFRPLASHPVSGVGDAVTVPGVRTPARVCQRQLGKGIDCTKKNIDIKNADLSESQCWDPTPNLLPNKCADPEKPLDRYHRASFDPGHGNGPDPNAYPYGKKVDYDRKLGVYEPERWNWRFPDDYTRWTTGTSPPLIDDPGSELGLFGSVWLHTDTNVGAVVGPGNDVGTGYHPKDPNALPGEVFEPEKLSNTFNVGKDGKGVGVGDFRTDNGCFACAFIDIPYVPQGGNDALPKGSELDIPAQPGQPKPPGQANNAAASRQPFPPYLPWLPDTLVGPGKGFRRYDAGPSEGSLLVSLKPDLVAALTPSPKCGAQDVTSSLGTHLLQGLHDKKLRWVPTAEPFTHQGAGQGFPAAVALTRVGGDQVVDAVITDGSRLLANGDAASCLDNAAPCGNCPSGLCDGAGVCCDIACVAVGDCPSGYCNIETGYCSLSPRQGSPHAVRYTAVLSRMRRGIFVVGGDDPESGAPTGEAWFTPLEGKDWVRVPLGFRLETALATTYSFATRELFVLDETAEGTIRLWAVRTRTMTTRQIGEWVRQSSGEVFWLVLDQEGSPLVVTSRTGGAPFADSAARDKLIERVEQLAASADPEARATICHVNDKGKGATIEVKWKKLAKWLGKGAFLGPCHGSAIARFDAVSGKLDGLRAWPGVMLAAPLVDGDGYTLLFRRTKHGEHGDGDDKKSKKGDEKSKKESEGAKSSVETVRLRTLDLGPAGDDELQTWL